jgi:hypothetical protein
MASYTGRDAPGSAPGPRKGPPAPGPAAVGCGELCRNAKKGLCELLPADSLQTMLTVGLQCGHG